MRASSTLLPFVAHQVVANPVARGQGDTTITSTYATPTLLSCTPVLESLLSASPSPVDSLGWEIYKASMISATCTLTLPSTMTDEYITFNEQLSKWWNDMPSAASTIHNLCGKDTRTLQVVPVWRLCDGPQTIFASGDQSHSTVIPKMEGPSELELTAHPRETGAMPSETSGAHESDKPSTKMGSSDAASPSQTGSRTESTSSHTGASSTGKPSATETPSTASTNNSLLFTTMFVCAWAMFAIAL